MSSCLRAVLYVYIRMTLVIDIIDGHGKVILYLLFISQQKAFNQLYIPNKMEHFGFKSRHAVQVAKLIKD